ncbi:MAG: HD domain-containing phosphohydrolase [Desulfobacteraceae bacterium]
MSDTETGRVNGERPPSEVGGEGGASLEVVNCYEKLIGKAIEIRNRVTSDQGISPSPILSDLHHIVSNDLIDKLYEYAMSTTHEYDEIIVHNVHVALASLRVGEGIGYDTRKLLELGLAAFLQNVGMYKIPEHILKKDGRLAESEMEVIRNHPQTSSQILSRMGARYKWLAEVASQVHERADGSGYPQGLRGPEISELASIIGLMDTYVAMIMKRPYRNKHLRPDAVKFIIKEGKGLFPPRILKVFLNQISLFPVSTYVRLNNKSIGRVISTDKNQPLRPKIELLYDGLGKKIEEKEIVRLSDNPLLYIVESIDETELA